LEIAGLPSSRWESPFPRTRCALPARMKAYVSDAGRVKLEGGRRLLPPPAQQSLGANLRA
jgi:hypothetical protein